MSAADWLAIYVYRYVTDWKPLFMSVFFTISFRREHGTLLLIRPISILGHKNNTHKQYVVASQSHKHPPDHMVAC